MFELNDYEKKLLSTWEEVYKKGQLTLWILLSLKESSKYMANMKEFIEKVTKNTLSVDDKSMYRALRRFKQMDLVDFREEPTFSGPALKVYSLTPTGERVLKTFIKRNITDIFFDQELERLLK